MIDLPYLSPTFRLIYKFHTSLYILLVQFKWKYQIWNHIHDTQFNWLVDGHLGEKYWSLATWISTEAPRSSMEVHRGLFIFFIRSSGGIWTIVGRIPDLRCYRRSLVRNYSTASETPWVTGSVEHHPNPVPIFPFQFQHKRVRTPYQFCPSTKDAPSLPRILKKKLWLK